MAATTETTTELTTDAPDGAALQAEIAALKSELAEKDNAVKFWYDKASASVPAAKKEEKVDEEDEDILELIGKGGAKGLKDWMAKQGIVTKDQVEAMVQKRASQLVKENQMVDRYPELKDKTSEFFKATSVEYIELKKRGIDDDLAMEMAAEKVELGQLRSGKRKVASEEEREQERLDRVAAQSGDKGRRTPAARATKGDTLSDSEKSMIRRFGISEDEYKKSRSTMTVADRN